MAEGVRSEEEKAAEQRRGPGSGPPPRGPMSMGRPAERSIDFGPSARRLLGRLRPHRLRVALVVVLGVVSVALSAVGPRVLGGATNLIFAGYLGARMPAGISRQQAIDAARAQGDAQMADLLTGVDFTPGQGIDFSALGRVLLLVLVIYLASAGFQALQGWILQGVVADTMFRYTSHSVCVTAANTSGVLSLAPCGVA